jgi:tRNA-specific 2-thiouridylase
VIGVPHYVLDFEETFSASVIDRFVGEYLAGRTPNPCVLCNQHVKLGAVLERTRAFGAARVATGHHARVATTPQGPVVTRARDLAKDQTYALWAVPREVAGRTLLPVGEHTKPEIRDMARRFGLPLAEKPESQDICFVPDRDYGRFVAARAGGDGAALQPGPIVDAEGREVGTHQGVARYTIGQRRGLGISHAEPLYVVGLDAATATVRVGPRAALAARGLVADSTNWISIPDLDGPRRVSAQIRYRHRAAPACVRPQGAGQVEVQFEEPQDAVTPGQSVVFYDGDVLLGGGVIRQAIP